jgi:hypothetical protein
VASTAPGPQSVAEVAVVHLVRRNNGIEPFERFLASYREHPAGVPHDLVLIFKGFRPLRGTEAHDRILRGLPHRRMFVADFGFDLRPYFKAVRHLDYRYFCFLNSFSRVLADDWLRKLYQQAVEPGVGLVGATGSYQSFTSTSAEREQALAGLPIGARLRWRLGHIIGDRRPRMVAQRAAAWMLGSIRVWSPERHFPLFPNYHVRTNAFMASRQTLARVRLGPIWSKLSAFMFESGRNSLTNQVTRMGLRPLVVSRDGRAFEKERWHTVDVFRQGRQKDLLIADNQTDAYETAGVEERSSLSRQAWGAFARPL